MKTILLHKQSDTGKTLVWMGVAKDNVLVVTHGQADGKKQTKETTFTDGKNIGKSNETTPAMQCLMELEKTARQKIEKDYVLQGDYTFTTINDKQVKVQNKEIPAPMLAFPIADHIKKVEGKMVAYQPKLNGFRGIYSVDENKFYSRSRKEFIGCPEIADQLATIKKHFGDIKFLDGELYAHNVSLEVISSIVSPKKTIVELERRMTIEYHIFDYVDTNLSFYERNKKIEALKAVIEKNKLANVKVVETVFLQIDTLEKTITPLIEKLIAKNYEGIMIRIPETPYQCKRSHSLFKYKLFQDCEAKCIGFKTEKNDKTLLGSLIMDLGNGKTVDATPAMTDKQKAYIFANQNKFLGKTGTIKFQNYSDAGIPIFPTFERWREAWDMSEG